MYMPVSVYDGSTEPPETTHYVVAANGIFLRKRSGWVDAMIPVTSVPGLQVVEQAATLSLPRVKSTVIAKAIQFFKVVYDHQKTEAAVLLHYSEKHGWELSVPMQEATALYVKYDSSERLPGFLCVGTMHSHGNMSAYHSTTDIDDEASQDGVHITIGRLDRYPLFDMDAEIVIHGHRFKMPLEKFTYLSQATLKPEAKKRFLFLRTREKIRPLYQIPFGILKKWTVPPEWVAKVTRSRLVQQNSCPVHSQEEAGVQGVSESVVSSLGETMVETETSKGENKCVSS